MSNHLYYGVNLAVLRDSIASKSVDLIYLDPPARRDDAFRRAAREEAPERQGKLEF
jgi:hypothetical protein